MRKRIIAMLLGCTLTLSSCMGTFAAELIVNDQIFVETNEETPPEPIYQKNVQTDTAEEDGDQELILDEEISVGLDAEDSNVLQETETETETEAATEMFAVDEEGILEDEEVSEIRYLTPPEETMEITLGHSGDAADASLMMKNYEVSFFASDIYGNVMPDAVFTGRYGDQLGQNAKVVYGCMEQNMQTTSDLVVPVTLAEPVVYQIYPSFNNDGSVASYNQFGSSYTTEAAPRIMGITQSAYDAFLYDCPQYFYTTTGVSFSVSNIEERTTGEEKEYFATISVLKVSFKERYSGARSIVAETQTGIEQAINDLNKKITSNTTQYARAKAIHDYICDKATYGLADSNMSHNITGFFTDRTNKSIVCDGYSKSFKILAEHYGLQVALVPGITSDTRESHMWDYVKLDGRWYLVDVTWDDQSSIYYNNFVKPREALGRRTELNSFSSQAWSVAFTIPEISVYSYSMDGHTHSQPVNTTYETDNPCIKASVSECPVCGEVFSYEETYFHSWGTVRYVITEPGCLTTGESAITCSVCGAVDDETRMEIEPLGHKWDNGTILITATCTEDGVKTYTCKNCGDTKTEKINATGHSWNASYTVDKAATCTETGTKSIHCSRCNAVKDGSETVIPKTEHAYNNGVITKEATCTEDGVKTYTCKDCGDTKTEVINATGHSWNASCTVDKAATCTETGTESIHCAVCDTVKTGSERTIAKKEHKWGSGTVVKSATCTKDGNIKYWCAECGAEKIEAVRATGVHVYTQSVTKATVFRPETIIKTCKECNKKITETRGNKLTPKAVLSKNSLSLKGTRSATVTVSGLASGDRIVSWTSSKPSVATVFGNGNKAVIKGKTAGKAVVTVTLASGLKKNVNVTVKKVANTKISNIPSKITIKNKKSYQLKPALTKYTTDQASYKSSNSKIASVSKTGKITVKKKGTVIITVKAGKKTVKCKVIGQ